MAGDSTARGPFGLTADAQALHEALIAGWRVTADAARIAGLSERRARSAVDELIRGGVVRREGDDELIPVPPDVASGPAHARWIEEVDTSEFRRRVETLVTVAQTRLVGAVLPPWAASILLSAAEARPRIRHRQLLDRGVKTQASGRTSPSVARVSTDWSWAFAVCDDHAMLFRNGGGTIISSQDVADVLDALFLRLWTAEASRADKPVPELTTRQAQLLHFLDRGHKDVYIARQLGVSERTLRIDLRALLEMLGAESRFQAGAIAARRGWI